MIHAWNWLLKIDGIGLFLDEAVPIGFLKKLKGKPKSYHDLSLFKNFFRRKFITILLG